MKQFSFLPIILFVLLLPACKPGYDKVTGQMKAMENRLYGPGTTSFDKVKGDSLMTLYQKFIDRFPKDTLTPSVVFKMANLAVNLGHADTAILFFDRYIKDYPEGPKAEVCLFFKAFVYENNLQDFDKAKELYLLFLEKYPKSEFADDAQVAINNLGKSPDQFFMEFEAKRKADSMQKADSLAGLSVRKKKSR
jgi:outer membrane protein assembly factor BamD (BamD/ComL family)